MSSAVTRRLAAVVCFAVIAVTAAIAISTGSGPSSRAEAAPLSALLAGIPERDGVLGDPNAKIKLTEFVDPQCPVCAAAAREVLPTLIRDYVRPGKVSLDARVLSFLGPDSVRAAYWADAARKQDRLWPFLESFFASQGQENSGYVTEAFLTDVAEAAGVDADAAASHDGNAAIAAANSDAERLGVTGTPTFVVDGRVVSTDQLFAVLDR